MIMLLILYVLHNEWQWYAVAYARMLDAALVQEGTLLLILGGLPEWFVATSVILLK
jgi:hypothetical protein